MTCEEFQSQILQSDGAADDSMAADRVVGAMESHAAGCAACGELVRKLRRLEEAVRSLPEPADSSAARLRFEHRYAAKLHASRSSKMRRWAAAAIILLAACGGVGTYLHVEHEHRAVASSDAIDRAVDFDLSLGQTKSQTERQRIFDEGKLTLAKEMRTRLLGDTREFADSLIHSAAFLTQHHDALAQADHYTQVADKLVSRIDTSAKRNPKALARLGQDYFNVMDQGVHTNLDIAATAPSNADSAEYRRKLQKIIQHNLQVQSRLRLALRDHPEQDKIRKQLDQVEHRLHRLEQQAAAATQPGKKTPKPAIVR